MADQALRNEICTTDFVPIMEHASMERDLVVLASSPFKTVKDLVEFARKNQGKAYTLNSNRIANPKMPGEQKRKMNPDSALPHQ